MVGVAVSSKVVDSLKSYKSQAIHACKDFIDYQNYEGGEMYRGFSQETINQIKKATSEIEIDRIMKAAHNAA